MKKFKETIVISVGGSLIYPEELDLNFILRLKEVIFNFVKDGYRIVLITGGGKLCRKYNQAAQGFNKNITAEDLDWLGIRVTKLNAEFLRLCLGEYCYEKIIEKPNQRIFSQKSVYIAAGWKPGASSDNMAVNLAKKFKAQKVINLSNIDYVYDKDPNKYPDAKRIEQINWPEFIKLVGTKWDPGAHVPFDPIASELAAKLKLEVAILNGNKIWNLTSYLSGGSFIGTIIKTKI
ncbi:MAG: UMP kinase [Candidatus Parcubacteria bacterium]|nr:UMP kinase [Candidatus Parcubacteria bacterium]